MLTAPTLEDLTPAKPVYATKSGAELDPQAVAAVRRKQLRALEVQKAIILVPHDLPLGGALRIRSKWHDECTTGGTEVKKSRLGSHRGVIRKKRRLFRGYSPAEGSTLCGQLGGLKRKETRVLPCGGGFRARTDR